MGQLPKQDQALYALGASHLATYFWLARGLKPAKHQREIMTVIQEFLEEAWSIPAHELTGIRVLNINLPPGAGKSSISSMTLPPWVLGNKPHLQVGVVSAKGDLATIFKQATLKDLENGVAYQNCFPDEAARPDLDNWTATNGYFLKGADLKKELTPSLTASGLFGSILGKRYDLIIIDDGQDQETARTPGARRKTWEFIDDTVLSRLDTDSGGIVINVQQRLHDQDISGMLEESYGAESVTIPALDENDNSYWKKRYNAQYLIGRRASMGDRFQAWYQQRPAQGDGTIFPRQVLHSCFYEGEPPKGRLVQSWDTALKDGEKNDYSAMVEAIVTSKYDIYITNMFWKKLEQPELLKMMLLFGMKKPKEVIVEDKGSGTTSIQLLGKEGSLPMIPYNPKGSKEDRARDVKGWFLANKVYLPKNHPKVHEFIEFFTGFPQARYDDPVDATTQLIAHSIKDYDPSRSEIRISVISR